MDALSFESLKTPLEVSHVTLCTPLPLPRLPLISLSRLIVKIRFVSREIEVIQLFLFVQFRSRWIFNTPLRKLVALRKEDRPLSHELWPQSVGVDFQSNSLSPYELFPRLSIYHFRNFVTRCFRQ